MPEAQRRDSDCGSAFLWLLSFGEAKEKATRSLSPYASLRATCAARFRRRSKQLATLKQVWPDVPPPSALLGSARTGLGSKFGFGEHVSAKRLHVTLSLTSIPHPVLAGLEKVGRDGLKNLDVRRRRSRLVSKFSGSFRFLKEPRSGPDCGSPFFSLGFFGEAKKSKSPAGASPGMLARGTGLTKARWNQEASK